MIIATDGVTSASLLPLFSIAVGRRCDECSADDRRFAGRRRAQVGVDLQLQADGGRCEQGCAHVQCDEQALVGDVQHGDGSALRNAERGAGERAAC